MTIYTYDDTKLFHNITKRITCEFDCFLQMSWKMSRGKVQQINNVNSQELITL